MRTTSALFVFAAAALASACQPNGDTPSVEASSTPVDVADQPTDDTRPYDGISESETLQFTGTEPFWGGEVSGTTLTYSTPENQDGTEIEVERFAGRGGIAFSGTLEGAAFEMMVTPLACSDGMSDRTYPFTVTLGIGEDKRNGCAWSEQHPFDGPEHP